MEWKQKFVTFGDMLDYGKANYPKNIAMANPIKKRFVRYDELSDAVDYMSGYINSLIDTDERFTVSMFGENSMEWMLVFLSAVAGNNIVAPINHQTKEPAEIRRLIIMAEIKIVFVAKQFKELFTTVIGEWPKESSAPTPLIIGLEEACTPVISGSRSGEATAPETIKSRTGKIQALQDDYAILLFTSGSINTKGVMHSQRSLLSNQQSAAELLSVAHQNEVFIAGLPLSHAYGLLCGFVPFTFGATAVYAPTPRQIAENIAASGAAFPDKGLLAAGVPDLARIMNQRIIRSVKASGRNSPPVKRLLGNVKYAMFLAMRRINYFTSSNFNLDLSGVFFKPIKEKFGNELKMPIGGGPTDKVTEFGLRGVGIIAVGGYGTTEMAPLVAANATILNKVLSGSVGQVPNGMEIKLINGEVCCRGPNMMLSYLKNEAATAKAIPGDGWYHTGDKGYFVKLGLGGRKKPAGYPADYIYTPADEKCYLILEGRVDNQFANLRGENIYPEVIESLLMNYQVVSSCRVFESPPSHVMAQVFPDADAIEQKLGKLPTADEIKNMVSQIVKQVNLQLQSGCGIEDFEVRDTDFERNAFGKIKRATGS